MKAQTIGVFVLSILLASAVAVTGLVALSSATVQPYSGAWEVKSEICLDNIVVNGLGVNPDADRVNTTQWGPSSAIFDADPLNQRGWSYIDRELIVNGDHEHFGTADLAINIGDPENYIFNLATRKWSTATDDMSYRIIEKAVDPTNEIVQRWDYHIYRFWVNVKTAGDKADHGWLSGWHGESSGSLGVTAEITARIHFSLENWRVANTVMINGSEYIRQGTNESWAGVAAAYVAQHGHVGVIMDEENNEGQWNSDAPIARILNGENSKLNMYYEENTRYFGYDPDAPDAIPGVPSAVDIEFSVELLPASFDNWLGPYRTAMQIVNVEASLQMEVHVLTKHNYVLITGDPPTEEIDNTYYEPPPPSWLDNAWAWLRAQMFDPLGNFFVKILMWGIIGIGLVAVIVISFLIIYKGAGRALRSGKGRG